MFIFNSVVIFSILILNIYIIYQLISKLEEFVTVYISIHPINMDIVNNIPDIKEIIPNSDIKKK